MGGNDLATYKPAIIEFYKYFEKNYVSYTTETRLQVGSVITSRSLAQCFNAWVRWVLGLGLGCGPRPKKDSEYDSIHFGIEIDKMFTIVGTQKMLGLKISDKVEKIEKEIFFLKLFTFIPKNFKNLLICIPKCIELNSESVFRSWAQTQYPKFFWV